jgi:hypothetical protein
MQMVVHKIKMDKEDQMDVQFWLKQPASDSITEVTRLRHEYCTWLLGEFLKQMQKVVTFRNL